MEWVKPDGNGLAGISILQALDVWSDLEQAYYGDNKYGGDTAEIYAYRLMQHSPAATIFDGEIAERHRSEVALNAASALVELCLLFQRERECEIEIDTVSVPDWWQARGRRGKYDHRCHVKVIR